MKIEHIRVLRVVSDALEDINALASLHGSELACELRAKWKHKLIMLESSLGVMKQPLD